MKKNFFLSLILICYSNYSLACEALEQSIISNDFEISLIEYIAPKSKKLVLIIPPTGGINFIDKSYALGLCKANINAVIIRNWTDDNEYNIELEIHTRFYNRAQRAIEMTIKRYSQFDLAILGTSVGGIHASIAFARFKKLKTGLFIVSGGNIASIITNTEQDILLDAKNKRFKLFNYKSDIEYTNALKKILPYEPLQIHFDKSKKKIGMVVSTNDSIVPTKNQIELKEKWNSVILSSSWLGHTATVIKTWLFNSSTIIDFFR
ncbi:MAG: hypothetical protein HON90_03250 [Halobacteriovoraceae bacterium]|jgi:hypothetical protein|nr:hypothetical protein [Halobacteriovoraceae bacterium]